MPDHDRSPSPRAALPPHDHSGQLIAAVLTAVLAFLPALLVFYLAHVSPAPLWAAGASVLFSFLLYLCLTVRGLILDRRYARALRNETWQILFSSDASVTAIFKDAPKPAPKPQESRLYVCSEGVILLCFVGRHAYAEHIARDEIASLESIERSRLRLEQTDGTIFYIYSSGVGSLVDHALAHEWVGGQK